MRLNCLLILIFTAGPALAQDTPTFYADAVSGCQVGTLLPSAGLSVRWLGPCVDGKAEGRGIAEWSENGQLVSRSDGTYRGGVRHGRALITFPDGKQRTEAEFSDGRMVGHCVIRYSSGARYDGQCTDNQKSGRGRLQFASGDIYEGEFRNDKFHGQGVYLWKNGQLYEGGWANDSKSGSGRMVYPDGAWFVGNYRDDKRDGEGQYVSANGGYYRGNFRDNFADGQGTYVGVTNRGTPWVWSGQWRRGCFRSDGGNFAFDTTAAACGF